MKFIDSQAVLVPFQKQLKKPRISDIVKLKELSIGTFKYATAKNRKEIEKLIIINNK